jgi:hypothetical protein
MLLYGDCKENSPSVDEVWHRLHESSERYTLGVGKVLLDGGDAEGRLVDGLSRCKNRLCSSPF